ncbi:MAG: radical SAM family heme chaperone HemW [Spirochaetales bacterium]|nr:radical SAM family heme chaperone HemW [Spirochaetales bacterium]
MSKVAGLYIHIPFCRVKCDYCSFYSVTKFDTHLIDLYLAKVVDQVFFLKDKYQISLFDTVFIGGGTPSLIPPASLALFIDRLNLSGVKEFTVEVNPESVTSEFLASCGDSGVNRISAGVQTFSQKHRDIIGRVGQEEKVLAGLDLIAGAGFKHFSIDLISHLPQDSISRISGDIKSAAGYGIDHMSIYSLSVEDGTPLSDRGATEADEDLAYDQAFGEVVESCGLSKYEISNYAKADCQSLHNLKYWDMEDFVGVGPVASGTICDSQNRFVRHENPADLSKYLLQSSKFEQIVYSKLSRNEAIFENFMMGLRLIRGIDNLLFVKKFQALPLSFIPKTYDRFSEFFLVDSEFTSLTPAGRNILNTILVDILDELEF